MKRISRARPLWLFGVGLMVFSVAWGLMHGGVTGVAWLTMAAANVVFAIWHRRREPKQEHWHELDSVEKRMRWYPSWW